MPMTDTLSCIFLSSTHVIDALVRKHSAFTSMADLLNAGGNYRPTLEVPHPKDKRVDPGAAERKIIADVYDLIQTTRGDERRAFRHERKYQPKTIAQRRKRTVNVGEG